MFVKVSKTGDCHLYLPNAFSPNGDNINDGFAPISDCVFENYYFTIYDRWGKRLFEANDPTHLWNGTYQSTMLPVGVYSYQVVYQYFDESKNTKYGTVSLIR